MSVVRPVPYKRYIESLLISGYAADQVRRAFFRRKLAEPSEGLVAAYRSELWQRLPEEAGRFYANTQGPFDASSLPPAVVDACRTVGHAPLFDQPVQFAEACRWFELPDLRTCLFAHVIARCPEDEQLRAFSSVLHADADPASLALFRQYFCDGSTMASTDWFDWILELQDVSTKEAATYSLVLSNKHPFELIQWKLNVRLSNPDMDKLLESITLYYYFRSLEMLEEADSTRLKDAHDMTDRFMKLYTLHKEFGRGRAPLGKDKVEEALFRLVQVRDKPKMLTQLEGVEELISKQTKQDLPGT